MLFDKEKFTVERIDEKTSRIVCVVPFDLVPLVLNFLDSVSQAARLYYTQMRVARASYAASQLPVLGYKRSVSRKSAN